MFLPNTESRLCEFQTHKIPPDLQFYPYLEVVGIIPVKIIWTESLLGKEGVWFESEKATTINWR